MTRLFKTVLAAFCLASAPMPVIAAEIGDLPSNSQILLEQGRRAFNQGDFNRAALDWERALALFRQEKHTEDAISTSLSLASAYQAIGQHRRAVQVLEEANTKAEASAGTPLQTLTRARLGAALVMVSQFERGDKLLAESLATARTSGDQALTASILNDQGNSFAAQKNLPEALKAYAESAELARSSQDSALAAQALGNAASTAARAEAFSEAYQYNTAALEQIERLPEGHGKAFLLMGSSLTDRDIRKGNVRPEADLLLRAHQSLLSALKISESLGDLRGKSYALGYLGRLYELDGQYDAALSLTWQAIQAAQQAQMPEALYRWEWQAGRVYKAQGEAEAALAAYRRAVGTLKPIRHDVSLGPGNLVARPSFRESEGPLFFELADLLLQESKKTTDPDRERQLLVEARDTVEQLKVVELEDYFCDECEDVARAKARSIEAVDEETAVVYIIPLPDRTEILLGLTSGLRRFTAEVGAEALTAEVRRLRRTLETRTSFAYLEPAQQIYNWLIKPLAEVLGERKINTLVFVPDGALRTIPFAALHNGERFLIEDFAVAVVPGLTLVEPRPIRQERVRLLLSGISQPVQDFPPLSFVPGELEKIQPLYTSDKLLDQTFTLNELQRRLSDEQYTIVHIASHGQFDRDVRKTFVLTYDQKLTLNDLEALIRPAAYRGKPVELLALSACQTAAGDDRAALGLAGVAVKAGARSALATLWFVNDQSTSALVSELYAQLSQSPDLSKARALQAAQIKLLKDRRYRHPCYWSPYLIIGNWL